MTATKLPEGVELTALDERFRTDPYAVLAEVRQKAPVHADRVLNQYLYTRHDDVREILRDGELFNDPRKGNPGTFVREFLSTHVSDQPNMLFMDDPEHRRLRSLVSQSFLPGAVEGWRPRVRSVVRRVLDAIADDEFDLIERFAAPIPTVVIAEMLGIDASRHADFKRWSRASIKIAFNPLASEQEREEGFAAQQALSDFFAAEIATRRSQLGDDLISDMLRAEAAGETLSAEEIVQQCNLLLVAGNATTSDLIGNGVKALLDHPQQLRLLRERPELLPNAIEEMLRFDPPVSNSARVANRTVNVGGCPVHRGESLTASLAAAGRDPDVYPDPDAFDIERADTHHLAFGGGRHSCLGAHLARMEAQEAIGALLERYPQLQHSPRGHRHAALPTFRGMAELWVRARPATA